MSAIERFECSILALAEGSTEGINGSVGAAEKKLVWTLVTQIQHFAQVYTTLVMIVTCMSVKQIYKFKVNDSISWHNYCLGSIPKDFTKDEQK